MIIVVMPSTYQQVGRIIADIEHEGFRLANARTFSLFESPEVREALASIDAPVQVVDEGSGIGVYIAFQGSDSVKKIREMILDLHHRYGTGIVFFRSIGEVENMENMLFASKVKVTATYDNCTCCVIKPHALKSRVAGEILNAILSDGYEVSAMQIFHLDRTSAAEFYEIYDGVVKEFHSMVDELTSGPAMALEIRAENAVSTFRQSAGPWDVGMAKELYPSTLRARFGKNRVENAIHCTDLEGDGVSEVAYFFQILACSC